MSSSVSCSVSGSVSGSVSVSASGSVPVQFSVSVSGLFSPNLVKMRELPVNAGQLCSHVTVERVRGVGLGGFVFVTSLYLSRVGLYL